MDVAIVGIGMHPFGRHEGVSALDMGAIATRRALADAGLEWKDAQFAVGGSTAWDSGYADALVSRLGLTGLQFVNVFNGCATAGTAVTTAVNAIRSGAFDVGVAVGFDKHPRGAFAADPAVLGLPTWYGEAGYMLTTQFFAMKIARYLHEHGLPASLLAKAAAKAYRNAALNPNAWRRKPFTEDEIASSRMLNDPLTQYMFCSPSEGAAAVVLCRADLAPRFTSSPVFVRAVTLCTRRFGSFEVFSPWLSPESAQSPTVDAARACFEAAGIGADDLDLAQIQDSEAGAEIIHLAENGLCDHGDQEKLILSGATEIGGRLPVNTDGGLIGNGEPIGASGMRQIYETVLQLRGDAGDRQVPGNPRVGFTQVYGAPGVGCCTILSR
jgi:acetyl-CoA acetyltransferase